VRLRRADVLLLDEPTASLDAQTEQWVIARIAELRRGKTLILLTHRAAPLCLADRVLRLDNGQLVAVATPCEPPLADLAGSQA
jgi:ABC-type transport system involved in cytochrome bd biosynthesis fused ATPase/permease subunit